MSITSLTTTASIAQPRVSSSGTAAGSDEFGQTLGTAFGHAKKAHTGSETQQQTDDISTTSKTASLADDTRALVGDVFGALGANTPTETQARQAVAAYQAVG